MRLLVCCCMAGLSSYAFGQALPTASRAGDLQIGVGYTSANSGYEYALSRLSGGTVYGDFDFRDHFGVDATFRQLSDPNSSVYQRTYEVGGRYVRRYGRLSPYLKGLAGRGVLNFPNNAANLGYNLFGGGVGADVAVRQSINVRVEFEYQDWVSAPGPSVSLQPSLVTVGIAYHFAAGIPRRFGAGTSR